MLNVVITDVAKENIELVLSFIEAKYGIKSRKKFALKLAQSTKIISYNPEIFPASSYN
jgi:plasmid stabilization system protein ParE